MLEKHDVKRSRTTRANGDFVGKAGRTRPATSGKTGRRGKTPAVAPYGLKLQRYFTAPGDDGFANVEWELRTAAITGENGKMVFEQKDVEVPKSWSQTATNVVVQKYFRGIIGTPERERSVRQLISRVADTITELGQARTATSPTTSRRACSTPSSSTCSCSRRCRSTRRSGSTSASRRSRSARPASSTASTTRWSRSSTLAKTEGMLFKYGSGTGTNLSPIRSSKELLNGGGTASGPVCFMSGFDAFAGVIKSGGKTRRAAKMVILNVDHPDVDEFIGCKVEGREEGLGADRRRLRRRRSTARRTSRSSSRTRTTRCASPTTSWRRCRRTASGTTARRARRQRRRDRQGARPVARHRRGGVAVRRSRPAVRHHGQRLAHVVGHGAHQRVEPVLASTCTSTTRPATWRR